MSHLSKHLQDCEIQMTEAGARPPYNVWNPISQQHIASGSQVVAADRYDSGIIKLS